MPHEAVRQFIHTNPTLEDYWRSIILFGRNVASYKFALGKSLIDLSLGGQELIPLMDLARPFSRHLCEHLRHTDRQGTSRESGFLETCRRFIREEIAEDELLATTAKRGFANVLDAFHFVGPGEIATRFFLDERGGPQGGIRITEASTVGGGRQVFGQAPGAMQCWLDSVQARCVRSRDLAMAVENATVA